MNRERTEHDLKNRAILDYVRRHPDATVRLIASSVGLGRAATQKRLTKLAKARKLRRVLMVDLDALDFRYKYRIDIKIHPTELASNETLKDLDVASDNPQMRLAFYIMNYFEGESDESKKRIVVEDVSIILGD